MQPMSFIDIMHNWRIGWKHRNPAEAEKLADIERKYGNINYLALDLPRIEMDDTPKFLEIWYKRSVASARPDTKSPNTPFSGEPLFRAAHLIDVNPDNYKPYPAPYIDLRLEFPRFYEAVRDLLPFKRLTLIKLWQSLKNVGFHRDDSVEYFNCPTEIRTFLYDENDPKTFCIRPEEAQEYRVRVTLPEESNTFAFNNLRCQHGTYKIGRKEKILAIYDGPLDFDKLDKLIERSMSKYAMFSDSSVDTFCNRVDK